MQDILFSLFQALQLAALGPCLFIMAFLLLTVRRPLTIAVPVLYFLSLAASFSLPLLPVLQVSDSPAIYGSLLFLESLTPALSFLLILQFIHGHPPAGAYWLVLAIPILGGSSFIYGALYFEEVCLLQLYCLPAASLKTLYHLAGSAMIFLLLIVHYSHQRTSIHQVKDEGHRYWLMMALILLNLLIIALDLALITGHISTEGAMQASTMVRIGFIYLVLTSLFRVFDGTIKVDTHRIPTLAANRKKPGDSWIIEKLERAMLRDLAYRECATLPALSERIAIPEHQLSRVINTHYGISYSDYINEYRISEAKDRLVEEATPITTIAYEVGFGSIASFNRVFKEKTGTTPSNYRKNNSKSTARIVNS